MEENNENTTTCPCVRIGKIRKIKMVDGNTLPDVDIFISQNQLNRIAKKHKVEFKELGLSAFDFVSFIFKNFNQIRGDESGRSFLLIVHHKGMPKVAVIELGRSLESDFLEIKNATPMRLSEASTKTLLWQRGGVGFE